MTALFRAHRVWKRLSLLVTLLRSDARRAWHAWRHPATPGWFRLGVVVLALYAVSPLDLVSDLIPVLGWADDLVLLPLGVWAAEFFP